MWELGIVRWYDDLMIDKEMKEEETAQRVGELGKYPERDYACLPAVELCDGECDNAVVSE